MMLEKIRKNITDEREGRQLETYCDIRFSMERPRETI